MANQRTTPKRAYRSSSNTDMTSSNLEIDLEANKDHGPLWTPTTSHNTGTTTRIGVAGACKATMPSQIFNLVKSIVGYGVLGLPGGISAFGNSRFAVVPASLFIIVIGSMAGYSFGLVGRVCAYTDATTYRDAWSKAVSPTTAWIPVTACILATTGCTVSFSMVLADTTPQLMAACFGMYITRTQALLGVTWLVLLPLCLLKQMSKLAPFSLLGIIGMAYTIIAMGIRFLDGSYQVPDGKFLPFVEARPSFGDKSSPLDPNVFLLISMLSTAYLAHYNAPKFYHDLRDNTLPRYYMVVWISFAISILKFVAIAALGYLTFGEATSGLVLRNYATQDKLMSFSRVAVAFSMIFSYPLVFVGVRDGILDLMRIRSRSHVMLNALTVVLLALITWIAFSIEDLRFVLALGGSTWGNAIVYLIPCYMFWCVAKKKKGALQNELKWAMLCGLTGLTIGIVGTARALASLLVRYPRGDTITE